MWQNFKWTKGRMAFDGKSLFAWVKNVTLIPDPTPFGILYWSSILKAKTDFSEFPIISWQEMKPLKRNCRYKRTSIFSDLQHRLQKSDVIEDPRLGSYPAEFQNYILKTYQTAQLASQNKDPKKARDLSLEVVSYISNYKMTREFIHWWENTNETVKPIVNFKEPEAGKLFKPGAWITFVGKCESENGMAFFSLFKMNAPDMVEHRQDLEVQCKMGTFYQATHAAEEGVYELRLHTKSTRNSDFVFVRFVVKK